MGASVAQTAMHEPCALLGGRRPAERLEKVEALPVAEVAEQQHADVMIAHRRDAVPIPPGKSKQVIPVPAPTVPSAHLGAEIVERRSTSSVGDRARIRHVAVVALADDGSTTLSGPRPEASMAAWCTVPTAWVPHR